jgi:hypothetical protein
MAQKQSYLDQANEYFRQQRWRDRILAARVPRGIVVKGGTLAALGGASAIAQILAACASGAAEDTSLTQMSVEGAYKYSKFPMIEKYNWRNLPVGRHALCRWCSDDVRQWAIKLELCAHFADQLRPGDG